MFPYVNKTKTNLLNIILSRYTFCNSCYYTVDVMACVRALISIKKKNHCHNSLVFISLPVSTCVFNWNIIKQITRPAWCVFRAIPFRWGGSP